MCKYITKARIKVSFAYFLRYSYINVHVHKFRFNTVDNKKKITLYKTKKHMYELVVPVLESTQPFDCYTII